jgi:uncharacterized protein (TIRG00374 family)
MKLSSILKTVFFVALLAVVVWYVRAHRSEFSDLRDVHLNIVLLLSLLFLIIYALLGYINSLILRPLGVKLSHFESFSLSIITGFYNLITPFKGGMAARAVYLKQKYSFTYTDFLATLAASYVIIFFIGSIVGLASTLLIYKMYGIFSWILFFVFLGVFLPMLFIILFAPKFKEPKSRFLGKVVRVINGWNLIKDDKKVIASISALTLLQLALGAYMLQIQFQAFGTDIGFVKSLFLTAINSLSLLLAFTPAGLGITEAVTVFSALTIGISAQQSLSAAILGRIVSVIVLFILGPIFSYFLLKKQGITHKDIEKAK